jgi:hypothetical protein
MVGNCISLQEFHNGASHIRKSITDSKGGKDATKKIMNYFFIFVI